MSWNFDYITYADNWSFFSKTPNGYATIPAGVHGANAFAVVNDDGSFDVRYPLIPINSTWVQGANPNALWALAVGGWNNSNPDSTCVQNMGLYNVLTDPTSAYKDPTGLTAAQRMLVNTLYMATLAPGGAITLPYDPSGDPQLTPLITKGLGYQCIIIDYEGFSAAARLNPAMVTTFMTMLCQKLPNVQVHMAIPGYKKNLTYMNFDQLMSQTAIKFHLMMYDFSIGPATVTPNASVNATMQQLTDTQNGYGSYDKDRFYVGFPNYSRAFDVAVGQTPDALAKLIGQGLNAPLHSFPGGDSIISDDDLLAQIGNWDSPSSGWALITVPGAKYNDYYYYQSSTGLLVSAFPFGTTANSVGDFASMVQSISTTGDTYAGFMSWEAQHDYKGLKMPKLMAAFNQQKQRKIA